MKEPLVVDASRPLDFPPYCVRCGTHTHHKFLIDPINPSETKTNLAINLAELFVPAISLVQSAELFKKVYPKVPLCWKCHLNHFLPDKKLITGILLLIASLVQMFRAAFNNDLLQMGICIFLSVAMLFFLVFRNIHHERISLPVQIYQIENSLRYIIYDGPFRAVLDSAENGPPENN